MTIKTWFVETWLQLASVGLLILGAIMLVAPFFISLIANVGRRVPSTAWRHAQPRRQLNAPRRAVS